MSFLVDFYNKVFSFFKPQDITESNVKDVARSRLKLVLMQDRTNLTPKILEQMRGELIDLLSKYVELDKNLLELNFEQEGDQVALMLSIPVIRAKDEREIEEALKKDALLKGIQLVGDEEDTESEVSADADENEHEGAKDEGSNNSSEENVSGENLAQEGSEIQQEPFEEKNIDTEFKENENMTENV